MPQNHPALPNLIWLRGDDHDKISYKAPISAYTKVLNRLDFLKKNAQKPTKRVVDEIESKREAELQAAVKEWVKLVYGQEIMSE